MNTIQYKDYEFPPGFVLGGPPQEIRSDSFEQPLLRYIRYSSSLNIHDKTIQPIHQVEQLAVRAGESITGYKPVEYEFENCTFRGVRIVGAAQVRLRNCTIEVPDGAPFGLDTSLCLKIYNYGNLLINGSGDAETGGKNYGWLIQGCTTVSSHGATVSSCHSGISITQGSGFEGSLYFANINEVEGLECHKAIETHGQDVCNTELDNVKVRRASFGNPSYPDGGENFKVHSTCQIEELLLYGAVTKVLVDADPSTTRVAAYSAKLYDRVLHPELDWHHEGRLIARSAYEQAKEVK